LIVGGLAALILAGIGGGLFNQFVWRPLRNKGASLISALVVSIGFSIFLRYTMLYIFGGRDGFYRDYRIQQRWDFGWFEMAPKDVVIMVLSVVILVAVGAALQFTRMGKAMRAVADNRDLAESSGIDVELVIRWVWISGTALAGLGGVLWATTEAIGWEMGFRILLLMFAGVTLGGLGTAYGALFGSLVVGVFIQTSTLVIPSDMKNVGALVMLVVILLVRPQGLLGRAERIG
jgi:branched-chain amino acid transport system permease protein